MKIDAFLLYNELDILDIRLNELQGVVDKFIIVESTTDFAGRPKRLFYKECQDRYDVWRDRITYVVVDDMPDGQSPYRRERYQRRCISRGLTLLKPEFNDTVIISDIDEIPKAEIVAAYDAAQGPHTLEQRYSQFYVNNVGPTHWGGSRIVPYKEVLTTGSPLDVRQSVYPKVPQAGWHFNLLAPIERIKDKLRALGSPYYDPDQSNYNFLPVILASGADILGRDIQFKYMPIDDSFPVYVKNNQEKFQHIIRSPVHFSSSHEGGNSNPHHQVKRILDLLNETITLRGEVYLFGAWEGAAAIPIMNAVHPQKVHIVDEWKGYISESQITQKPHPTVLSAQQRDVYILFLQNCKSLTQENYTIHKAPHSQVATLVDQNVRFAYLDTDNDYESVKTIVKDLQTKLVPGGILCGNNMHWANVRRADLSGGVERAVQELLPNVAKHENLWCWKKPND